MSKFNSKAVAKNVSRKTVNKAGGAGYSESARLELASILLTSMVNDKFYETAGEQLNRLGNVFDTLNSAGDAKFAAKAAVYSRNVMGMRSISQALAGNVAAKVSGEDWTRNFFRTFPKRVDDLTELLSFYQANFATEKSKKGYARAFPNALKYGLRDAFDKFDRYQLSKYRGEGRELTLIDVVNILHPKPNEKNADALHDLVNGTLKSVDTWETKVSAAGQEAETAEEAQELKGKAFAELLKNKKMGYMAVLKNLRNIAQTAPDSLDDALAIITDENLVRKSLVFPFRFLTAVEEIEKAGLSDANKIVAAISQALDYSVKNVPEFPGKKAIVLDVSGSMTGMTVSGTKMTPARIGAMFAAIMLKANPDADLILFASTSAYKKIRTVDSVLTMAEKIGGADGYMYGGGTNLSAAFQIMDKHYDRIFVLSDMQSWIDSRGSVPAFSQYTKKYGNDVKVFSFDLAGYGQLSFPEKNVYAIAGFSDKILALLERLDGDKQALIKAIDEIEL